MGSMFHHNYWDHNHFPSNQFVGGMLMDSVFVAARGGNTASASNEVATATFGNVPNTAKFGPSHGTAKIA